MRALRGADVATVPPGGAAMAAGSRLSGGQAGRVVVLSLLLGWTSFFPALSSIAVVTVATTAWATAAAAAAVAAVTGAAVLLSASGRTGCEVPRGEKRTMVGYGEARGDTLRRARRGASGGGGCGRL